MAGLADDDATSAFSRRWRITAGIAALNNCMMVAVTPLADAVPPGMDAVEHAINSAVPTLLPARSLDLKDVTARLCLTRIPQPSSQ